MKIARSRQTGFTIVEIVVVIAVIAILAVVSIVAYGGIRERASKSAMLDTVDAYAKAIEMYKVKYRKYPPVDSACIGSSGQYPDIPGKMPSGMCYYVSGGGGGIAINQQLQDMLNDVGLTGSTKISHTETVKVGPLYVRGVMYGGDSDLGRTASMTYGFSNTRPDNCGRAELYEATDIGPGVDDYYGCQLIFK